MNQSANTSIKQAIQTLYSQLVKALDFTPRLVQRQMIAAITNHLLAIKMDDHGQRCCDNPVCAVEAGTGTGKTLAYISACLPIAQALNKQMVIATATITLQEQIMARELLSVRNHGRHVWPTSVRARAHGLMLSVSRSGSSSNSVRS